MTERADKQGRVSSWDGKSEASLRDALRPPTERCIEKPLAGNDDVPDPILNGDGENLSLVMTTNAAYRTPVVKVFVGAMADRTDLPEELRERIYTAVQEALMNAVMHGNLKIDSSLRDSVQNLMIVHETIERLLGSPNYSALAIRVEASWSATSLNITVSDSGTGFVRESPPTQEMNETPSGRGLGILEAMCDGFQLNDGGRSATMKFRR